MLKSTIMPITDYAIEQIRLNRLVKGKKIAITPEVEKKLPNISDALKQIGYKVVDIVRDGAEIQISNGNSLFVEIEHSVNGSEYCLGKIPFVKLIAQRCLCDYHFWRMLFDESSDVILAGKKISIDSYCNIGRVIAQKARNLGMIVLISDSQPLNLVEALNDGFELKGNQKSNEKILEISIADLLKNLKKSSVWEDTFIAIHDELVAACLYAIAMIDKNIENGEAKQKIEMWSIDCDNLITATYLSVRGNREELKNI